MQMLRSIALALALAVPALAQVGPASLKAEATPNTAAPAGEDLLEDDLGVSPGPNGSPRRLVTFEATISLVGTDSVVDLVTTNGEEVLVNKLNAGTAVTAGVETTLTWRACSSSSYNLRPETTTTIGKLVIAEVTASVSIAGRSSSAGGGGGGASQTPWTSDIVAAGYDLTGVGRLEVTDELDVSGAVEFSADVGTESDFRGHVAGYSGQRFSSGATAIDESVTQVLDLDVPVNTNAAIRIDAFITANDGHNYQAIVQTVYVACANKGGTFTISTPQYPAAGVGNASAASSGTLVCDWTATEADANQLRVRCQANTSLTLGSGHVYLTFVATWGGDSGSGALHAPPD